MDSCKPETEIEKECTLNGNCSPETKQQPYESIQHKNIDDISTPSDLQFDQEFEFDDPDIIEKKKEIERCLENPQAVTLEEWQHLAKSKGGLVCDAYRRRVWPLLLGVMPDELTEPPSLQELSDHVEYNQVVLDVNRSLKRFPPGVPYARRVALQDQLTALILRVMARHPRLRYYQGYHDVAITLLLVAGARAAFPLLARLSAPPSGPLAPFMRADMSPTQRRLACLWPLLSRRRPSLAAHMRRASVGTMFALPWFLTWFGHSLPRYRDVVRLYDYFLCAHALFPVYVTAALVLHRGDEVMECECDMAALHCLLSRLPEGLPWEQLLVDAASLFDEHPPHTLEEDVLKLQRREEEERRAEEAAVSRRRAARAAARGWREWRAGWYGWRGARRYAAAGAAVLLAVWVYYRPELLLALAPGAAGGGGSR